MQIIPATTACPNDAQTSVDTLDELLAKQAAILCSSRWHATIDGLPHHLAWRIHQRLEQLQAERPLTGMYLRARCGGVKTTILHDIVNNSKWGRSRLASRGHNTRKRKLYSPYNQALLQRKHSSIESATDGSTHE